MAIVERNGISRMVIITNRMNYKKFLSNVQAAHNTKDKFLWCFYQNSMVLISNKEEGRSEKAFQIVVQLLAQGKIVKFFLTNSDRSPQVAQGPVICGEDERPLKRLRTEEDDYKSIIFRILNWMLGKQPKSLPPVPKTQKIVMEGDATIYTGKNVAVGTDQFEYIVNNGFSFVDKTLFIEDFLRSGACASLILRPRRSGKTTNLTMLREFFSIPIHPDNNDLREELFKGSNIWKKKELFQKHFCQYPVIFISLKDFQDCYTWELMQQKICGILAKLYKERQYLLSSLSPLEKRRFNSICEEIKVNVMTDTLKELSKYLRRYYSQRCIVLIDEYDHPLDVAFRHNFHDVAGNFFATLFGSLLKGNDANVFKGLMVGVTRIAQSDHLSGFNNVIVYTMLDDLYADKFGFTEKEVSVLLKHHQKADQMVGVKQWYNGYETKSRISLYNPSAIISFIEDGILRSHRVNTGSTDTIQRLIWRSRDTFKDSLVKLLNGNVVRATLSNNLRYDDLYQKDDCALWTLLYYAGYLTHKGSSSLNASFSQTATMELCIPNKEVEMEWTRWLQLPGAPEAADMLFNLLSGDLKLFYNQLQQTILQDISFHDVGSTATTHTEEPFYHGYIFGLLAHAKSEGYTIKSNQEAGIGRFDVEMENQATQSAAILEFKFKEPNKSTAAKNKKESIQTNLDNLAEAAQEGLSQINSKLYESTVSSTITQIVKVGIAFQGMLVALSGEVYEKIEGDWQLSESYEGRTEVDEDIFEDEDPADNDNEMVE